MQPLLGKMASALVLASVVLGMGGCKKRHPSTNDGGATLAPGVPGEFSETYVSKNKLVTAHYPPEFAAKTSGKSIIVLSRNRGKEADVLTFVSIEKPISDEVKELSRVILLSEAPSIPDYKQTSSLPATCNGYPGIETKGTWTSENVPYLRSECVFVHGGHGYAFTWVVSAASASAQETLLRSIREAAELNP